MKEQIVVSEQAEAVVHGVPDFAEHFAARVQVHVGVLAHLVADGVGRHRLLGQWYQVIHGRLADQLVKCRQGEQERLGYLALVAGVNAVERGAHALQAGTEILRTAAGPGAGLFQPLRHLLHFGRLRTGQVPFGAELAALGQALASCSQRHDRLGDLAHGLVEVAARRHAHAFGDRGKLRIETCANSVEGGPAQNELTHLVTDTAEVIVERHAGHFGPRQARAHVVLKECGNLVRHEVVPR